MKNYKPDYCPEWFNLNNYSIINNKLPRYCWSSILLCRQNIYKEWLEGISENDNNLIINHIYRSGSILDDLIEMSNIEKYLDSIEINYKDKEEKITDINPIYQLDVFPVRDIVTNDVLRILKSLAKTSPDVTKKIIEYIQLFTLEMELNGKLSIESEEHMNLFRFVNYDLPIKIIRSDDFYPSRREISIDLQASDETLIEQFKKYLSEERRKREEKTNESATRYTDAKINRLITNKVIPYIDLYLYQIFTGNNLTNPQIADLLFPTNEERAGIARSDTIRKITHINAMELLEKDYNPF